MTNLLDHWRCYCQDLESPDIFIDATLYAIVSAALQRNIAYGTQPHLVEHGGVYTNIYVVFIGPSRVGKSSAANPAKALYKSFTGYTKVEDATNGPINLAPDSITLAQLYRYLGTRVKVKTGLQKNGTTIPYISTPLAFFAAEELENLMKTDDDDIIPFLTEGWSAGDFHRETKGQGIDFIKSMCVTLLGCATGDWIKKASACGLLRRGFASRTIFIYADKRRKRQLLYRFDRPEQIQAYDYIRKYVQDLTKLYGAAVPDAAAAAWFEAWYLKGGDDPINKDHRCQHYYDNKKLHLLKMAMVCHFVRTKDNMTITIEDFENALAFLSRCEIDMHKAVMGSGINAAYDAACAIEEIMDTAAERFWPKPVLLARIFGEHCKTIADFDSALQYLQDLKRVTGPHIAEGQICYRLQKSAG